MPFGPGCCGVYSAPRLIIDTSVGQHWNRRKKQISVDNVQQKINVANCATADAESNISNRKTFHPTTDSDLLPTLEHTLHQLEEGVLRIIGPSPTSNSPSSSESSAYDRPLRPRLDNWLDEIFSQTLHAQVQEETFVGGAKDQNPRNPCPVCFQPLGDERGQHLLHCKYVHEELGRMEKSVEMVVDINRKKRTAERVRMRMNLGFGNHNI